ncbi:hypothetical protein [Winogradskyella flava]|uniref:Uncharacterized protein n=2 Tax=Winogradskyella flava TaxID=1884876 RepID=A0A842IX19_9FLAO|nr:hypothetical protein [Winogradskyella flava]MBC2845328.1 hypothetical protein [Winogradskyella flava]
MRIPNSITPTEIDPDVYKVSVIILLIIIGMSFVLTILRTLLEHKLKNKMLEKDISERVVASILQKDSYSAKHISVKWVLILMATGIGLFITNQYLPLGIHSIGIMTISIAIGFLCNALYLNRFSK